MVAQAMDIQLYHMQHLPELKDSQLLGRVALYCMLSWGLSTSS